MGFSLSNFQRDALREIGNIGAGNAITSMAQLINKRVYMDMPSVNIVRFDEMIDIVGGPEEPVVVLFFRIFGEAPGSVYFILSIEEAESFIYQMTNETDTNLLQQKFNENEFSRSALEEIGNIVAGSYLSALSDFININMSSSIPHLSIDMAGAILTAGLIELSPISDYAVLIQTKISESEQSKDRLQGHFFLLPDPESFSKIFAALGIKNDG